MFRVTFQFEESGEARVVKARPAGESARRVGLPGSILDIASEAGVDIDHSCGGVCACTTCHVKVIEGRASCPGPTADEEDMLETARGGDEESRLACQCVPDGTEDVVVVIPRWDSGWPGGSAPVPAPGTGPRPTAAMHAAEPQYRLNNHNDCVKE